MPTTPRARARVQTMNDIVRIGREHLATDGATALSLRAVARDLGVVSSAVYRYVRSRDELLTLLVIDGYNALGDEVDASLTDNADDPIEHLRIVGRTIRRWALAEPARYGLLFGTPVPGYDAPAAETVAPGTRVIATMQTLFARAHQADLLAAPDRELRPSAPLAGDFARIRDEFQLDLPDWLVARGVTFWVSLIGVVSADVFDMYGTDTFADRDELFELQLDALLDMLGYRG
ncbi:TetR/AcrR family transcriptional regulator [Nocardia sp. NBC_00881]|uniref:TetR/AcrR family transcriptional regulator n=1 Tax=Nocardia sp. NBC_00881 TaxID=2975995 RepID=UPI00386E5ABF|nr:TetR/AcrR family transcriptional regulator [Nocardia sp. NBC_00881]